MTQWRKKTADEVYTQDEVQARLAAELPKWTFEDGWIRRKYKTSGWKSTLMVVNTVGHLSEAAWHHPDLNVSYAFVTVKLVNHAAKLRFMTGGQTHVPLTVRTATGAGVGTGGQHADYL